MRKNKLVDIITEHVQVIQHDDHTEHIVIKELAPFESTLDRLGFDGFTKECADVAAHLDVRTLMGELATIERDGWDALDIVKEYHVYANEEYNRVWAVSTTYEFDRTGGEN